jgi:hypothetical protein
MQRRARRAGPSDPTSILVTDVLSDYARERGPKVTAPEVMGRAVEVLTQFWQGMVVSDVTPQSCEHYLQKRARSNGTTRRELGVLQTAINWAHKNGRLTRSVPIALPPPSEPRDRWLTRREAATLVRASGRKRLGSTCPCSS